VTGVAVLSMKGQNDRI